MNTRKCVHAQKPYPAQAVAHELSKVGGRGKRGRETGKTEARRLMERKATQQNKTYLKELKEGLPTKAQADVKYGLRGGGRLTPPSHRR